MAFERLRALIQRRVRYRVTRGGALFALALVLTGTGAFLSANNLLYLIFCAMLALLLVSSFLSRLVLSGLELELLLPEHVSARVPSPAHVRLRNLKRFTPSFAIELGGQRDPLTNTPSILADPVYFPLVPGRAVVEAPVEVTFPRRGRHRENLFVLSTGFPFGFLRRTTVVALRHDTIVFPSLEPREDAAVLLENVAGEVASHERGAGLDFYRIRPYQTTDSARLVDWKSTAHTGHLQVREFSREQQRTVEIFLDRRIRLNDAAWFERAVERCASLGWSLAERDIDLCVRSQRFALRVPGDAEIYAVLRFLALVEPLTGRTSNEEDELPLDPSSVQLVFSMQPEGFENLGWRSAE